MKRHVLRWTCLFLCLASPLGGRLGTHAPSVAAMTALIVCMRFSAS